jgi:hypothetical protein
VSGGAGDLRSCLSEQSALVSKQNRVLSPGRSSQQNRPFEMGAKFWSTLPMPSTGMRRYLDRARLPLHNTPHVPYNRLKMLPHLGPELPSPLESFFSKGRFCCELLPGARQP